MQADTRGARNERHVDTERGHTRQGPTFFLSFFFFCCCCCCCCVIMCGPKQTTSPNEIQTRTEKHSKIHQLCVCLLWQYVRQRKLSSLLSRSQSLLIFICTYVKCCGDGREAQKYFCQLATLSSNGCSSCVSFPTSGQVLVNQSEMQRLACDVCSRRAALRSLSLSLTHSLSLEATAGVFILRGGPTQLAYLRDTRGA